MASACVVLLVGTHVTGKETLAVHLSQALACPWIKAEAVHCMAHTGAQSQSARGYSYEQVFARIWISKLRRAGLLDAPPHDAAPAGASAVTAVVSCSHMRKPDRDAIRLAMAATGYRLLFVVLHITEQTLSGRTLGAEQPALAGSIYEGKKADIEPPLPGEEPDVVLVDNLHNVADMFDEVLAKLAELNVRV